MTKQPTFKPGDDLSYYLGYWPEPATLKSKSGHSADDENKSLYLDIVSRGDFEKLFHGCDTGLRYVALVV